MSDKSKPKQTKRVGDGYYEPTLTGTLLRLGRGVLRDLMFLVLTFLLASGATALVCLYYDLPLFLSLLGGILVLGIALALKTDSLFD